MHVGNPHRAEQTQSSVSLFTVSVITDVYTCQASHFLPTIGNPNEPSQKSLKLAAICTSDGLVSALLGDPNSCLHNAITPALFAYCHAYIHPV